MVIATRRTLFALSLLLLVSTASAQEVIVDRAISTTLDSNLQPLSKGEVYPGGVYGFGASDGVENIIGGQREMTLVAIPYMDANSQGDTQVGFTAGSAEQTTFSDGTNAIDPGAGFGLYPSTAAGSVGLLNVRWDGLSVTSGSAPALALGGDFSSLTPTEERPFGSLEIHLGAVGTNTIAEVRLYSSTDGSSVTGCTIMYAYNAGDLAIEGTDFSNTGAFSYVDDETYLNLIVPADAALWASGEYPTIATCPGESVGYADLADIDAIDLNVYYGIEPAMYNLVFAGAKGGDTSASATLANFPAIFADMNQMATLSANLKLVCPATGGSIVDCSKIDDGYELESDPLWIRGGTFRVVRRGAGPVGRGFTVVRRSDGGNGPVEELGGEPQDDGKQQVTFQVDLNPVIEACWFDPASDVVTLPGSFNGWDTQNSVMSEANSLGVYTTDLRLDPGTYEYKYFLSSDGWEYDTNGGNRSVTVSAGEDLVLPVANYNKSYTSICGEEAIDYDITFVVNMSVAIADSLFNPDTDVVSVAGSFNDWSAADATVLAPFPQDPNIYTATITESVFTPDTLYFKYLMRSGDVVGWEEFGYSGSNPINRDLILTGNETSTQIVTVDASGNPPYFNDIGPSVVESAMLAILGEVPLSQDTSYIPVFLLGGETQDGIYAMDMTLDFDPSVLEITGAMFMGTLMENLGFTYEINTETTGQATIAIAGSDPVYIPADLSQPAVLFGLQVVPVAPGQSTISLSNGVLNQTGTITLQDFQPNDVFVFDDTFVLGDVDANGDIQSYDASLILQHIVEKITLDEGGIKAGDVDGDPGLTAADASTILQYRVALIDCFPVQSGAECGSTFNKSGTLTVGATMQPPAVTEDQAILSVDLEVVGSMTDGLLVLQGVPDHWTFTRAQGLASDWIQSARQQGGRLSLAVAGAYGVSGATSLDLVFSAEATGTVTDEISLAGQFNGGRALAEAAIRLEELPQTLEIESIYPSPFTSHATVSFTVPEAMDVRLSVFDMLGREVGHLVDGVMEAGSHQVRWESEDVRSGLYIVRLESGSRVITRSLVKVAP